MPQAIIFDWIGTLVDRNNGPYSWSKEVLSTLSPKYRLGLISKRSDPEKGRMELEKFGLSEYFDSVVIARRKTIAEFIKCMNQLDVSHAGTHVVGDRTIREIRIGNQIGCTTYWIQRGEHSHELPNRRTGEPSYRINSVKDLLEIL